MQLQGRHGHSDVGKQKRTEKAKKEDNDDFQQFQREIGAARIGPRRLIEVVPF